MYGLMHARLLWWEKIAVKLNAEGFGCSQADPCAFWRQRHGNVVVIIVVDDRLLLSELKDNEQEALGGIRFSFSIKDLGSHTTWGDTLLATGRPEGDARPTPTL